MSGKLSERDICTKYITPALKDAGWDIHSQIREECSFTAGKIIVRGKMTMRGKAKRADYILYYKPNIPIAIIEAKDGGHSVGAGMQQGLDYAEILDIPFVFSSNGSGFLEHDRTKTEGPLERNLTINEFPSPAELWQRYREWKGLDEDQERIVIQDYYSDGSGKQPRYYQLNAINRTMEAIAKGQDRILLVMATGTGKTYTAFQIIWRLWKAKKKKRILFLADRNILVDQTKTNDFKPFGGAMYKIANRNADTSYEIYLSLYQAITGTEEEKNIFKQFSRDFFDLVIIDECHRGSAKADSAWREILDYFKPATQIGLTATPKETKDISNIDYFGEPVYTYSLKQGIEDGFLAPYKVVRIDVDIDSLGYRPPAGKLDRYGNEIEDRIYNIKDIDRTLVIDERTKLVARKVTEFLKDTDRFAKTIVFCEDTEHAERMRQAIVNENGDMVAENKDYVVRITGDDDHGKMMLDDFIHPENKYPVIATTSKLLSTGVDCQTVKLIVLDQRIQSMTEFKQIIGRGTRIREDQGKLYFTIMDFRKATDNFADPEFDGEPVQIYTPTIDESPVPPNELSDQEQEEFIVSPEEKELRDFLSDQNIEFDIQQIEGKKRVKYYVDDVPVAVIAERVQYYDKDGKLVTESLKDYTRRAILEQFESLDQFLKTWSEADKKQAIFDELKEHGVFLDALREEVGKDYSAFDLICHVAFDQPAKTRKERAEEVRKNNYFTQYGDKARQVLNALLDKYADQGSDALENPKVLLLKPISDWGTPYEIISEYFGGKAEYEQAVHDLMEELYRKAS